MNPEIDPRNFVWLNHASADQDGYQDWEERPRAADRSGLLDRWLGAHSGSDPMAMSNSEWRRRFDDIELAVDVPWGDLAALVFKREELSIPDLLGAFAPKEPIQLREDRVFISHRQGDEAYALRIAQIAAEQGWNYWVDVLDPRLKAAQLLPSAQQALATAAIIEMALLNCSRLIAVWSPNTQGSLWIPYEYGRVKEKQMHSMRVSCWRHPNVPLAEYLYLAPRHETESEIRRWLKKRTPAVKFAPTSNPRPLPEP